MILRLHNLTLGYERHPAVHHLCADIPLGSMVAIVGPNGAGKSTLLKGLAGQLKPLDGEIKMKGISQSDIAYLPQQCRVDRQFPITVFELAAMGLWRQLGPFKRLKASDQERIFSALKQVGLMGFEGRSIDTLSGGQMQRLLFARLILQDARLLLLDEPFNAIDSTTCDVLLSLLKAWHDQGRTIMAVWHDIEGVTDYFPQSLLLARELIAFGPTKEVLTPEHLKRAQRWQAAFDDQAALCDIGDPC